MFPLVYISFKFELILLLDCVFNSYCDALFIYFLIVVVLEQMSGTLKVNLDTLQPGATLALQIDSNNTLRLYVNDVAQCVISEHVTERCHALVELYGQCREVCIVRNSPLRNIEECPEKARMEEGAMK